MNKISNLEKICAGENIGTVVNIINPKPILTRRESGKRNTKLR
jgi:hypothetical protein